MSRAILLIGSPAGANSTSHALGSYLSGKLEAAGWQTTTELIYAAKGDKQKLAELAARCAEADLLIFAFPLYVDHLPGPVVATILALEEHRRMNSAKAQKLLCIVNCGFPESYQNDPAVAIMENFARSNGYTWLGGLALGMGGMVSGQPLPKLGGRVRNVVKALDMAAADIIAGNTLSKETIATMRKKTIPRWLYMLMANVGWGRHSKLSKQQLSVRPYRENAELAV
jgi:hypothetical protein